MNSDHDWLDPMLESAWAGPGRLVGWSLALLLVLFPLVSATCRAGAPEAPEPGARSLVVFDQLGIQGSPHQATTEFARLAIPDELALEEAVLEESEDQDEMLPSPVALPSFTPLGPSGLPGSRLVHTHLPPLNLQRLRC